jgi:2'-5' RNA ligase
MNLSEHYNELFKKSSEAILSENYTLDTKINNSLDKRFGITLLIRPSQEIKDNIQLFLEELKKVDHYQYYYPDSDIHITVMSIISCYEGFTLDQISSSDYIEIVEKSLVDVNKIEIEFQGVTASSSAVMIQGFPVDDSLGILRNKLRENFKNTNLQQSIDIRYSIATAHMTVMRFKKKLENPEKLIEVIERFRNHNFGKLTVDKIELVFNDWYQREKNTKSLCDLYLKYF